MGFVRLTVHVWNALSVLREQCYVKSSETRTLQMKAELNVTFCVASFLFNCQRQTNVIFLLAV